MSKKAFITGVNGQDGAWLAKLLLDKGYEVYGGVRRSSSALMPNLDFLGITDKIKISEFDLLDYSNIYNTIKDVQPDEFYNLAAQSHVGTSFKQPLTTFQIDSVGVNYVLDILHNFSPETKFYQASTSEMFGGLDYNRPEAGYSEESPFHPRSPYGVAKLAAHWMTVNYRESYDFFGTSGILFNHESELRGPKFVTRKITLHAATWANGNKGTLLELGNMDAKRDWGWAKEYVECMYLMLQQEKPDTFVIATGETTTVRDFVEYSFAVIDREIRWEGEVENEKGFDKKTGEQLVGVNSEFYRPAEVDLLLGDPSKAKNVLGWEPKVKAKELAEIMVKSDVDRMKK
jgi:GDPmannose 4,6-dehydratase